MALERNDLSKLEERWDMSAFYAGKAYFESHFEEIKAKYYGEYVVIFSGQVVAHSTDLRTIAIYSREHYPDLPVYSPFVGDTAIRGSVIRTTPRLRPTQLRT